MSGNPLSLSGTLGFEAEEAGVASGKGREDGWNRERRPALSGRAGRALASAESVRLTGQRAPHIA